MSSKSSSRSEAASYTVVSFWLDPTNQFWEKGYYSESAKDYYRNWLRNWQKKERALAAVDKDLK